MGSANGRRPPRRTEGKDKRPRKRTVAFRAASGHRRPTPVAARPAPTARRTAPTAPLRSSHKARRHRSEEHTSELQSLMRNSYAVFCLKKKKKSTTKRSNTQI